MPAVRRTLVRHALRLSVLSVLWSGGVGGAAVVIALGTGSLSLLGFGVDAAVDAAASIALIWRFSTEARQPARAVRVEKIAERVVGSALVVFAAYLAVASVRSLVEGHRADASPVAAALLVASLVLLPPLAILKYRVARQLGSGALRADSVLTGVAALLAAISLVGLGAMTAFGLWWADSVGALVVSALVLREGAASIAASRRR